MANEERSRDGARRAAVRTRAVRRPRVPSPGVPEGNRASVTVPPVLNPDPEKSLAILARLIATRIRAEGASPARVPAVRSREPDEPTP